MRQKIKELLNITKDYKLLYVEDNKLARESTAALFEKIFNITITAIDGQDGLEKFKQEKDFDLIITDINMPKMDGIEMIKEIREIDNDILIIILSAHNEQNYKDLSYKLNITEYLTKPVTFPILLDSLLENLEGKVFI
jgi:YesN/AraC family two-component response regulator